MVNKTMFVYSAHAYHKYHLEHILYMKITQDKNALNSMKASINKSNCWLVIAIQETNGDVEIQERKLFQ